jgi:hypothetical protein
MQEEIQLYEAIRQMRALSREGIPFSFVHSTYNMDYVSTNGKRYVKNAILRTAAKDDDVANADFKLFYSDLDLDKKNQNRNCWQHLIMFFNDKKVFI